MKKIIKTGLKFMGGALGLLLLIAGFFVAFNFTLVKNLPSAQDGGLDAMYIANQNPRQLVAGSQPSDMPTDLLSKDSFAAAQTYWEGTEGKALLVWHKGKLVYEHYADGIQPSDRSRSFSMHKSILGLVAATMEADGLLDLDDPVSLYVEAYKSGGREALTLRNMLQHQTGLERYSFSPPDWNALNLLLSSKVEKTAIKAEIVTDPSIFDYSNINYQVAGAVIRKVLKEKTSQTYAEYLSSRIWAPSGAGDAYLWSETKDGAPRFYAGLQATARDWLKMGILVAENNGSIVPKSAIELITTPSAGNAHYGLGLWLGFPGNGMREYGPSTSMRVKGSAPFTLRDTVFFDGFGGQRVYISQNEALVVVRIGDVRFDWDDTLLPNLITEALAIDTGVYERTMTLQASEERTVNMRIVSPRPNCKDCTLAVLSHGAFANNTDYDAIAFPLAQMGYEVVIPTHADSKANPNFANVKPSDYKDLRIDDHNAILAHYSAKSGQSKDWLAVGHSFGGMMAALYGGAAQGPDGIDASAMGLPSRVIALSPPGEIQGYFPTASFSKLSVPTLLITGTTDIVPGMIDDWEDHLDLYENAPKGRVTALIFENQNHYFNGLYGREITRERSEVDKALISLMQAFLTDRPLEEGDSYRILR